MYTQARISAVVIARNEGLNLRSTVENLSTTLPAGSEIMVVDDGSTDGCSDFLERSPTGIRRLRSRGLGVARARNWGAHAASGDVIVFADAHIKLPSQWWEPLITLLEKPRIGAVAPCISDWNCAKSRGFGLQFTGPDLKADWLFQQERRPYPVPILPGCCLGMRRDTFLATGGFDSGLMSTGGVDNELGLRLWLLGYELWVVPDVEVVHLFRKKFPYTVSWTTMLYNRLRLAFAHFNTNRISEVLTALYGHEDLDRALTLTVKSDISGWRSHLTSRRAHDDNWFFERFGLEW